MIKCSFLLYFLVGWVLYLIKTCQKKIIKNRVGGWAVNFNLDSVIEHTLFWPYPKIIITDTFSCDCRSIMKAEKSYGLSYLTYIYILCLEMCGSRHNKLLCLIAKIWWWFHHMEQWTWFIVKYIYLNIFIYDNFIQIKGFTPSYLQKCIE